jgi:hypothetical protein
MDNTLKPYVKVKVFEDPKGERGFEGVGILVHSCDVSLEKAEAHPGLERWGVAFPKGIQIVNRWVSPQHLLKEA